MGLGRKPDPREQYKSVHTPGFCPPPRNCGCCCSGLISTSRRQKAEGRKPGPMSQSRLSAQPHFGDVAPAASITDVCERRAAHGALVVRLVHVTPAATRATRRMAQHRRKRGRPRVVGRALNTARPPQCQESACTALWHACARKHTRARKHMQTRAVPHRH